MNSAGGNCRDGARGRLPHPTWIPGKLYLGWNRNPKGPRDDGSADLQYILAVADDIAKHMNGYKVIVDKSTVPIGTARLVRERIQKGLDQRGVDYSFDVVSNPEFLREGSAVYDFMHPDRIIVGVRSEKARDIMRQVY